MLGEAGEVGWWISVERAKREQAPFVCDAKEESGEKSGRENKVKSPPAQEMIDFSLCEMGTRSEFLHAPLRQTRAFNSLITLN